MRRNGRDAAERARCAESRHFIADPAASRHAEKIIGLESHPRGRSYFLTKDMPRSCRSFCTRELQICGCSTLATWLSTLSNRSSIRALGSGRIKKYHRHAELNVSFAFVAFVKSKSCRQLLST
jgi:hypothetical protein